MPRAPIPPHRIVKLLKCFVTHDAPYRTQNNKQLSLRPYLSAKPPTIVPKIIEEPNPTMKSCPTAGRKYERWAGAR